MKFQFLIAIGIIFSTNYCVKAQQTINASITHDGIQREYILYVPANYTGTASVPLLFNFHGYTSNANDQMWYGDFRGIADTAGFIIVHPQGTIDGSGETHFNVGWGGSSVDDVGYTSALIDTISAEYNINLNRVYSTGMSNGGFMSFLLACELSDRIAGIASVTGSIVPFTLTNCNALHPTPVMQFHGTSDGVVPYDGGIGWSEPITSLLDYWANYNNCNITPQIDNVPDINGNDGSTVEKFTFLDGDSCVEVVHFKITNGGHTWPGTIFNSAGTNYDIDASVEIWNFLSQYDINGKINCEEVGTTENDIDALKVFPNPASSELRIEGIQGLDLDANVFITDLSGSIVLFDVNVNQTLDITSLNAGMYLIHLESSGHSTTIQFTKQ